MKYKKKIFVRFGLIAFCLLMSAMSSGCAVGIDLAMRKNYPLSAKEFRELYGREEDLIRTEINKAAEKAEAEGKQVYFNFGTAYSVGKEVITGAKVGGYVVTGTTNKSVYIPEVTTTTERQYTTHHHKNVPFKVTYRGEILAAGTAPKDSVALPIRVGDGIYTVEYEIDGKQLTRKFQAWVPKADYIFHTNRSSTHKKKYRYTKRNESAYIAYAAWPLLYPFALGIPAVAEVIYFKGFNWTRYAHFEPSPIEFVPGAYINLNHSLKNFK